MFGSQAVVAAWQSGAISRDTMFELFRSGEILPDGRTNEDEKALIAAGAGGKKNQERRIINKKFFHRERHRFRVEYSRVSSSADLLLYFPACGKLR